MEVDLELEELADRVLASMRDAYLGDRNDCIFLDSTLANQFKISLEDMQEILSILENDRVIRSWQSWSGDTLWRVEPPDIVWAERKNEVTAGV